jgi:hypothetical protein
MPEPQATQNVTLIAAVVGAAIAFVTGIATAIATHYFTEARNRRQAESERAGHRRKLLRAKLEELISDLLTHISELEQLSLIPFPLAATLAVGSPMPWKYDEEKLAAKSFVTAQTIGSLYFPEFIKDIANVGRFSRQLRSLINEAIKSLRGDPQRWLESSSDEFNKATNAVLSAYNDALVQLLLKARQKLHQEYL